MLPNGHPAAASDAGLDLMGAMTQVHGTVFIIAGE